MLTHTAVHPHKNEKCDRKILRKPFREALIAEEKQWVEEITREGKARATKISLFSFSLLAPVSGFL